MRINMNREGRISIKRLTNSDLDRSVTTHQTHIGLTEKSLTFMGDRKEAHSAILIHKNSWFVEPCDIAKISRKNGKRDATKISMGGRNTENLVSRIRNIASSNNHTHYMVWFGSDTGTPVFWLVRKGSADFNKLNSAINLNGINHGVKTFSHGDREFSVISEVIETI